MPRFTDECVSLKIRSGVANRVNELPSWEIVCPVQNFQKSALRRERATGEDVSPMVLDYNLPPPECLGACFLFERIEALERGVKACGISGLSLAALVGV